MRNHRSIPTGRSGMTLMEVLLGLALTAALMVAIAYAFASVSNSFKSTQVTLAGLNSARVAMDYLTAQVRAADNCSDAGTTSTSGDATFPSQTTELSIQFGGGAARSDCNAGDLLELHLKVMDLGGGATGLRIWKVTPGNNVWNGAKYRASDMFDIPGVTLARITYNGPAADIKSVQIELTIANPGPNGTTVATNLVGTATVRR